MGKSDRAWARHELLLYGDHGYALEQAPTENGRATTHREPSGVEGPMADVAAHVPLRGGLEEK